MAACIPRTKATNRMALSAANGVVRVSRRRRWPIRSGLRQAVGTIPAQDVGGRREENAPAVGQPRDAPAITERLREIVWY